MITLKPHNQKAVEEILAAYRNGKHSVIYTSGVGTGKTFVFMGLAERICRKEDRILYVMPKYTVQSNILEYDDFKALPIPVDFVTFNYFTDTDKGIKKISRYRMLVIDECHHLGSDLYGKNLLTCMNKCGRPVLGLTATPERDHTNTDIREDYDVRTYFDATVEGISTFDAIRLGLMPPFEYRIMMPDKNIRQLEREYDKEYDVKVDYMDCENILKDIVRIYDRRKWICFFSSVRSLHEAMPMVKRIFKDYTVCVLYADLHNLTETIRTVQTSERAVVLSVNMLLEGVHLPDITGIVLFRHVTSLVTFQQILGRVCSMNNTVQPLVADCSQSGPLLLRKLLNENQKSSGPEIVTNGVSRPIMSVGLGAERPWKGIQEFLAMTASATEKREKDGRKAAEKYLLFRGNIYKTEEEYKESKRDWERLTACARLYHVTPWRVIDALKESA